MSNKNAASTKQKKIRDYLDELVQRFERPSFIDVDPISVAHVFSRKQDIEIAGFVAASFAWGQRPTILAKSNAFLKRMGDSPYEFIMNHEEKDRAVFEDFVHRTFQPLDALYFLDRLQRHYRQHDSLETLFSDGLARDAIDVGGALRHFHDQFFDVEYAPHRTRKHVATPSRKSSCKRLNMYLRWMVRPAAKGVDFGLWKKIDKRQLLLPLDVHVQRVATRLGLLSRKQADWQAVQELTAEVRKFDPKDPAKYDFALFGLGVLEKYGEGKDLL
ncbi:MAG: TIGR02757 family protein [Saprospiraceae bacterium]